MPLSAAYDPDNLFAKILRKEIPSVPVYEDDDAYAFMDVFPQSQGHTLVIPKNAPSRNFFDIEPDALKTLIVRTQKVATAVYAALKPDGVRIVQFNGSAAGQTIFHIHFHIIPVFEDRPLAPHAGVKADTQVLEALAERIRAAF